jgi:hypothetical protein
MENIDRTGQADKKIVKNFWSRPAQGAGNDWIDFI